MAHWTQCAVTNEGVAMLNEWMAGRTITLTSVYGGAGLAEEARLQEQTGLLNPRQKLSIIGETDGEGGKTLQIQVFNQDLKEEYLLNQIGVFAKLDTAEERLLFLMQDPEGVTIPAGEDESFLLELYCLIGITNNGRFQVSVDSMGIVTAAGLRETLAQLMERHNASLEAHPPLWDRLSALDSRLSLMELMYETDVRGNPFIVDFDDLVGLKAAGIWNAPQKRLEF